MNKLFATFLVALAIATTTFTTNAADMSAFVQTSDPAAVTQAATQKLPTIKQTFQATQDLKLQQAYLALQKKCENVSRRIAYTALQAEAKNAQYLNGIYREVTNTNRIYIETEMKFAQQSANMMMQRNPEALLQAQGRGPINDFYPTARGARLMQESHGRMQRYTESLVEAAERESQHTQDVIIPILVRQKIVEYGRHGNDFLTLVDGFDDLQQQYKIQTCEQFTAR